MVRADTGASSYAGRMLLTVGPYLVIVLSGLVAYHNCFDGAFVLDDYRAIVRNPGIRSLWPLPAFHHATQRPVTETTFALNYAVSGLNRPVWQAVNLLIHLTTACLWFHLIRRLLQRANVTGHTDRPKDFQSDDLQRDDVQRDNFTPAILATIATCLWVVHPLTTEAVTYTVQRSEALAACGMLAALVVWGSGRWTVDSGQERLRNSESQGSLLPAAHCPPSTLLPCLLLAFLAAGSKQTAVVLPLLVLLADRVLQQGTWTDFLRHRGLAWCLLWLPALWIVGDTYAAGLLGGVESAEDATAATAGFGAAGLTPRDYLQSQPAVILYYLWLILSGTSQSLDYGWPVTESWPLLLTSGATIIALLAASCWLWRRWPVAGFAALSFWLLLAPTSSLVPIRDLAVEHRLYLPAACVLLLLTLLVWQGLGRLVPAWSLAWRYRALGGTALLAAGCLITATIQRNADYADEVRLWKRATRATPQHPRVWTLLAEAELRHGDTRAALASLQQAVLLYETSTRRPRPAAIEVANALSLLGMTWVESGQLAEARDALSRAVELAPGVPVFHSNLGAVLQRQGEFIKAEQQFQTAIELASFVPALINLARLKLQQSQPAAALELLQQIPREDPRIREAELLGAGALTQQQRYQQADDIYRRLSQHPEADSELYLAWGKLDRLRQDYHAALGHFREAARCDPRDPWPLALQAEMLARLGDFRQADLLASELLAQLPADSALSRQLQQLRASLQP